MNTSLDAFFAELKSVNDLDQFVQDHREEDLHLEFKQKTDTRNGDLCDSDREHFSRAVSGFANSDGGILLFGVKTKKSPDSPDRASALKPITNADRFQAKLLDSIMNTTQPSVDGVRVEVVPSNNPNEGFVKCLIPASEMVPHRAMFAKNLYWRRMSSGCFRKMEHYELEEVFGRRQRPSLRLCVELRPRPDQDTCEDVNFFFLNEGRGLAHHAGFTCKFEDGTTVMHVEGNTGLRNYSKINANQPIVSYYDPHQAVHANGIFSALGQAWIQRPNKGSALLIDAKWYAENMNTKSQRVEIEPNVMKSLPG